jgi:DNA helicase-2/ATP-dependent DNA helicase PcrA
MIYKYYGPPGTGKTHRLINRAKAYARIGTPLHKIGYFAFSKKAAGVARQRMPADDKKIPYFQTLHSFCFNYLNINMEDIMQPYHYEKFGKEINVKVKYADKYNKEEVSYLTCDNPYFQLIHKAVNKCITVKEEYGLWEHDPKEILWGPLKYISDNLIKYKQAKNLYDFNDLVDLTIKSKDKESFPKFKAVFIDEAQDLSPLQWKLFDVFKEKSEDVYLAGDDDQAIFVWAGADVKRFIKESAKERVLKYSKRVSRTVQEESQKPIEQIAGIRKEKNYLPRDFEGESLTIANINQVDLTKGKWLILSRTISRQIKIAEELKKKNLYYETNKGKSFAVTMYKAAMNYESWTRHQELEDKIIKEIKEYTGDVEWNKNKDWFDAFVEADEKEKLYIKNMLDNKEDLNTDARIWLSTIHAAKGGEEDNVILCLDMGKKILKSIKRSQDKNDEEHRVWYVGTTRARNNLYKLKAKIKRTGYQL